MKFTTATNTLLIVSAAGTLFTTVTAWTKINATTYSQTVWAAQGDGPFDLGLVYPLYSSTQSSVSATHCSYSNIVLTQGMFIFTGANLPVNLIYYGSGFTATQKTLLQNFLGNIGSTSYWSLVKAYNYNGLAAATPALGSSIWSTDCITSTQYGLKGCSVTQYDEQGILNFGIDTGRLVNQKRSIYAILLGTSVKYTSDDGLFVLGQSAFCGTNSISCWGSSNNYAYISTQLPTSSSSTCNIAKALGGAFPNEYAIDNLIAIVLHELVEAIVSPSLNAGQVANFGTNSAFHDECSYAPADKCNNMYLSVGKFARNANIQVGGSNYLVFPLYDIVSNRCAMSSVLEWPLRDGQYSMIMSQIRDNFCMDIPGWSTANGAIPIMHDCHGGVNQRWAYNSQDQTLRVLHSGKCLDVPNGNGVQGQKVQQWDCINNGNQKWIYNSIDRSIRWAGNMFLCLDVSGGSDKNDAQLQLWNCHGQNPQIWNIGSNDWPLAGGQYSMIKSQIRDNFCMDIPGWSTSNGAIPIMHDCHNGVNQQWAYNSQDQTLRVLHSGKCLDVPNGNGVQGQKVQQWDCINNGNQKWIYNSIDKSIRWAGNMFLCLDVSGGSDKNDAQLQLWNCHGQNPQIWNIS
jgi:hypothetical protein